MRRIASAVAIAATALSLTLAPAAGAKEKLTGEEKLAKMLEGRTAGEPRNCLSSHALDRMTVINDTAIVYRDGRTLWVNVPRNAQDLDDDDVMVTRQFGTQLCKQDTVTTMDRMGGFFNGVVFLGDFVPYRVEGADRS